MAKILFWALSLGFALPAFAADFSDIPIDRFFEVSPGIYRGARPEEEGMQALAKLGVKTVLNIDDDEYEISREQEMADRLGLRMISKPLSGFWAPSNEDIDSILALMNDPQNYPIFVHCRYGRDRTGLVVGLYRVAHESWTPADAHDEMVDKGFRTSLIFLDQYFSDRTGY